MRFSLANFGITSIQGLNNTTWEIVSPSMPSGIGGNFVRRMLKSAARSKCSFPLRSRKVIFRIVPSLAITSRTRTHRFLSKPPGNLYFLCTSSCTEALYMRREMRERGVRMLLPEEMGGAGAGDRVLNCSTRPLACSKGEAGRGFDSPVGAAVGGSDGTFGVSGAEGAGAWAGVWGSAGNRAGAVVCGSAAAALFIIAAGRAVSSCSGGAEAGASGISGGVSTLNVGDSNLSALMGFVDTSSRLALGCRGASTTLTL